MVYVLCGLWCVNHNKMQCMLGARGRPVLKTLERIAGGVGVNWCVPRPLVSWPLLWLCEHAAIRLATGACATRHSGSSVKMRQQEIHDLHVSPSSSTGFDENTLGRCGFIYFGCVSAEPEGAGARSRARIGWHRDRGRRNRADERHPSVLHPT